MPARNNRHNRTRGLMVFVGLVAGAAAFAAPAHADPLDDAFLSALDGAGMGPEDPGGTAELGKAVCPMLQQPGKTFASVASEVGGNDGMSPAMAQMVTGMAIRMYCPSMMDSLADGQMPHLPQMPGLPGMPGMPAGL